MKLQWPFRSADGFSRFVANTSTLVYVAIKVITCNCVANILFLILQLSNDPLVIEQTS